MQTSSRIKTNAMYYVRRWPLPTAVLIVTVGILIHWHSSLKPTKTFIPTPVYPSPNAFDYFVAAGGSMSEQIGTAAANLIVKQQDLKADESRDPGTSYTVCTLKTLDEMIRANQAAFNEEALGLHFRTYSLNPELTGRWNDFSRVRQLARCLVLAGELSEAHGNVYVAMRDYLTVMEIGVDIQNGAPFLSQLTGQSIEGIGRRPVTVNLARLSASQCEAAALRLVKIGESKPPPYVNVQEEKWSTQRMFLRDMDKPSARREYFEMSRLEAIDIGIQVSPIAYVLAYLEPPRTAYNNYAIYMDAATAAEHLPWPAAVVRLKSLGPTDPLIRQWAGILPLILFYDCRDRTANAILETQLALRAYKLTKGQYPANLTNLVPKFLPEVPIDPFSNLQQLRYRRTSSGYCLYSIGPDAVDNGGVSVFTTDGSGHMPYYRLYNQDQKGDVVAGITDALLRKRAIWYLDLKPSERVYQENL
jgi:hypothetical protein